MRLNLDGHPYTSRSIIASNQRRINLYGEQNKDPQAPVPYTEYPTPGSTLFGTPNVEGSSRGFYRTSLNTAYEVIGTNLYFLASNGAMVLVGTVTDRPSQIIMSDNGIVLVLVDGVQGWAVDLATNTFGEIIDPAFYGADFVVFLDTFFIFNRPDTNQFYISLALVTYAMLTGGTGFDPLDIAAKSGSPDYIVGIATVHKELWLIGQITTEVWIGTGAADFYFQLQQGAYIDHGCAAPYSIASQDVIIFWIMQDKQGSGIVVKGANYQTEEISTPAIVAEFKSYATMADAIGTCLQIADHAWYVISFPTANKTWIYDLTINEWSEWVWLNIDDGTFNRHRLNNAAFVYGKNLISDWETGKVLELSINTFTDLNSDDEENPIPCLRTFMHIVGQKYERVSYLNFDADMEVGTSPQIDLSLGEELPQISLSWSDNKGKTFGDPVMQTLGNQGDYLTTLSWNRLGSARDRVFKLQWSANLKTALNGVFIELLPHRS